MYSSIKNYKLNKIEKYCQSQIRSKMLDCVCDLVTFFFNLISRSKSIAEAIHSCLDRGEEL